MSNSPRNQFKGKVVEVVKGPVMSEVDVETAAGVVTAVITSRSLERLALSVGTEVVALAKATDVAIELPGAAGSSFRNQFSGTVSEVVDGQVMSEVDVDSAVGPLTAVVTARSIARLGLKPGTAVVVAIKATELAIELA